MTYNLSQFFVARFTIQTILEILFGLEFDRAMIKVIKAGLTTVTMITVGDYCSVTPGVLQVRSVKGKMSAGLGEAVGLGLGPLWSWCTGG